MKYISLELDVENTVSKASETLRKGGVILYPTDTLYGLGVDAFSDEGVATVRAIKGREVGKPIHAIFADISMAEKYAEFNNVARVLAAKFMPGPLTLILKKKVGVDGGIAHGMDTIGIRIPNNQFCLQLAKAYGKPYTTTSANKAGEQPALNTEDILAQLGSEQIDLVIDGGALETVLPSTVVSLASGQPVILREGALLRAEIMAVLS